MASLRADDIFIRTPLIESRMLTEKNKCKILLKLENTQPAGSFKLRGISNHCCSMVKAGYKHLVSSSGGSAGLAAAYVGRQLNVPVTVYVPKSTNQDARDKIKREGANVVVFGEEFDDANKEAERVISSGEIKDACLIHPFNHPDIWQGHATMIHEIKEELKGIKPDAVVVAVGGGGLLCGILEGLSDAGWKDIPVIAMETKGADAFAQSIQHNEIVTLPAITSVAKCLGARRIADKAFEMSQKYNVLCHVVSDDEALSARRSFADDHRMLVQTACGAALAAVYGNILTEFISNGKIKLVSNCVVIIVCGGSGVRLCDFNIL